MIDFKVQNLTLFSTNFNRKMDLQEWKCRFRLIPSADSGERRESCEEYKNTIKISLPPFPFSVFPENYWGKRPYLFTDPLLIVIRVIHLWTSNSIGVQSTSLRRWISSFRELCREFKEEGSGLTGEYWVEVIQKIFLIILIDARLNQMGYLIF